jgi:hypothetical protein
MNQHKLPAVLGIVILAGILIYIVKLNEQTKQEVGDQDRRLTATKGDQTQQEEDIRKLRADLEGLREALSSANKNGASTRRELKGELEVIHLNELVFHIATYDSMANTGRDLTALREEHDRAVKKLGEINATLVNLGDELKALKAKPGPAPKPAAVTSSGQPK